MPIKKTKSQKGSVGQPHVAEDARKTSVKNKEINRSLSERRQRNVVSNPRLNKRSAFSSSASGLTSGTKKEQAGLKVEVFDIKGKVVEKMTLPKEIFGAKINNQLMAQAVRVYLANQRRGTASTKTRGEVTGSTRKIYRQKGTGRARHGSIRAPIFVHGGVVFGPKPRDYSLNFPKKMRRAALFSALSAKLKSGEVKILKGLEKIEPKTKKVNEILEKLSVKDKKKKFLLVTPKDTQNVWRASRNIKGVDLILANQMNTYQTLKNGMILFMQGSIEAMQKSLKGE